MSVPTSPTSPASPAPSGTPSGTPSDASKAVTSPEAKRPRPTRAERARARNPIWRWLRRVLLGLLTLVLVVVLGSTGYVGYATVRHDLGVELPVPTGRFAVGRVAYDWTDRARLDPFAPKPGTPRRLAVWLWYPAAGHPESEPAPYAPGAWAALHVPSLPGLGETRFDRVRTHSHIDAPVASGRFPVVILQPGLGFSAPQYASIAESLASHGYLVAGFTPTYSANVTVLDGRVVGSNQAGNPSDEAAARLDRIVGVWAADARFVASRVDALGGSPSTSSTSSGSGPSASSASSGSDTSSGPGAGSSVRLAGHVAPGARAYVGHSLGGAASLQACAADRRCAGAVDLDGTVFGSVARSGVTEPTLLLGSDGSCITGVCSPATADDRQARDRARQLVAASGRTPITRLDLRGATHLNFTDYGAYYLAAPLRSLLDLGPIDGRHGLEVANAVVVGFVEHAVRGRAESLLPGRTPERAHDLRRLPPG